MTNDDTVIAFGLLTKNDLDRLGASFSRVYPISDASCFGELLAAIDEAERELYADHGGGREDRSDARECSLTTHDP